MSEHCGYIVKIKEIKKHSNADRLQIATIFGASVIVDLNTKVEDIGIYFPIDLQLSSEYCEYNNLVRKKDENGNNVGGYLDPEKRNIRAMKLRGEKSEGLFMPLSSLGYLDYSNLKVGDKVDIIDGHEICRKYIPRGAAQATNFKTNKKRNHKVPLAPLFSEHADTEQLMYNLQQFKAGDKIELTLKMHGTSGRTGYLPKLVGFKRTLFDKIFHKEGKPIYDWGYVTGTRRVVLSEDSNGGYYGSNAFRESHAKLFEGKLNKGETVYYEIVGFTDSGTPIMPSVKNSKISDKEFTKKYGQTTVFSYGCAPTSENPEVPQSKIYVYRMTITNEDGYTVEYSPDLMRYRCEQMGIETVPVFWSGTIPSFVNPTSLGEWVVNLVEDYYDGPDPVGKTHVREGVVVRIINRPSFTAYKHKNFSFKVLEGIIKDTASEPDMEEAQEL